MLTASSLIYIYIITKMLHNGILVLALLGIPISREIIIRKDERMPEASLCSLRGKESLNALMRNKWQRMIFWKGETVSILC